MNSILFEDLVKRDYEYMLQNVRLASSPDAEELLFLGSVEGHAKQGHGYFKDEKGNPIAFPNATREDIVTALGADPYEVKKAYQKQIDEFRGFLERIINGEKPRKYVNNKNQPLFGMDLFKYITIKDHSSILIGAYLASRMDNYFTWRRRVEDRYNIIIGGGECIGASRVKLKELGYTLNDLSGGEFSSEEVSTMVDLKVLYRNVESSHDIVAAFVRNALGKGTNDGLGALFTGRLYGEDALWGFFGTDATDTADKYPPFIYANGQDEQFGDMIKDNEEKIKAYYPNFALATDEETLKFIYAIAKQNFVNETMGLKMVSESQRYFLEKDRETGYTAIESHLDYLRGKIPIKMRIGFGRKITNHEMYEEFEKRFDKIYSR